MKKLFCLLVISIIISFSTSLAFAATSDLMEWSKNELTKWTDDYTRILCLTMSTYLVTTEICDNLTSEAQPEFVGLSDAEVFEKFFVTTLENNKLIEEQSIFDPEYLKPYYSGISSEEELVQKFKDDITLINKVTHDFSAAISELEFRGYVFESTLLFDDDCNATFYLFIKPPEYELPKSTASEFEIYKWISDYSERLNQETILMKWMFGDNFENVVSGEGKEVLVEFVSVVDKLNESVQTLQEKRSAENVQEIRDALNDIETKFEKYEDDLLVYNVDMDEKSFEYKIEVTIESKDYFEKGQQNQNCLDASTAYSGINSETQQVHINESQMWQSLQFVEYKVDTFPSPKVQFDYGVSPNNVSCNEGHKLLLRPNLQSSVCVTHNTLEKLVERGWHIPKLI